MTAKTKSKCCAAQAVYYEETTDSGYRCSKCGDYCDINAEHHEGVPMKHTHEDPCHCCSAPVGKRCGHRNIAQCKADLKGSLITVCCVGCVGSVGAGP